MDLQDLLRFQPQKRLLKGIHGFAKLEDPGIADGQVIPDPSQNLSSHFI